MAMRDDPRRRRGVGGGGTAGLFDPGQMNAFVGGVNQWDYSGPMGRDFALGAPQARGGSLLDLLAQGPSGRHFGRQGFGGPPDIAFNDLNAIGGPNVAPGNMETGQSIFQPGVPPGVARGQSGAMPPGQAAPHTQYWRNYAPGGAAAAFYGYGTPAFDRMFGGNAGAGRGAGPAPTGASAGRESAAIGRGSGLSQGAVGTSRTGPTGAPGARLASGGPGGGNTTVGEPAPGGGNKPKNVTPQVKAQAAGQGKARGGGAPQNYSGSTEAKANLKNTKAANRLSNNNSLGGGGSSTLQALSALGNTVGTGNAPNQGNNNTPSEMNTGKPNKPNKPKPPNKGQNNTPSETNFVAPPAPKVGKKKSTSKSTGGRQQGQVQVGGRR